MNEQILQIDVEPEDALLAVKAFKTILAPASVAEFLRVDGAKVLQSRARERFNVGGDDASGKWKPLRFATESIREAKGFPPGPINERTFELFDYVTGNWGTAITDGEGAVMDWPSPHPSGELFEKLQTAQQGKKSPPTVARPVVAADEVDMRLMTTAFSRWFRMEVDGQHNVVL